MESCVKFYTWINDVMLMLLVQILWKINQISGYFMEKPVEETKSEKSFMFSPLTKESKQRRHIRSMSDVQSSTPYYRIPHRSRKWNQHILTYDSDTRVRRIRAINRRRELESSTDSSDYFDNSSKMISLEQRIMKHSDSMRIL